VNAGLPYSLGQSGEFGELDRYRQVAHYDQDNDFIRRKESIMKDSLGEEPRNVLGSSLAGCCTSPVTGFYRNGRCDTGPQDFGAHVVCTRMSEKFLQFSKGRGNDLSTPMPEYGFPGLKPGDCWCLCAARWQEALEAGMAPPVSLLSTHERALDYITLADLKKYALDLQ
jgi:uncharacterized protein (DUF2237 family)